MVACVANSSARQNWDQQLLDIQQVVYGRYQGDCRARLRSCEYGCTKLDRCYRGLDCPRPRNMHTGTAVLLDSALTPDTAIYHGVSRIAAPRMSKRRSDAIFFSQLGLPSLG
jgi:hypothetical protein